MSRESSSMMSVTECRELMLSEVPVVDETMEMELHEAAGRLLSESLTARLDIPPEDNSAMDGYALHEQDLAEGSTPTVTETVLAGQARSEPLQAGECVRIMTGAPVPPETAAVVPREKVSVEEQADGTARLEIHGTVLPGDNIRRQGEDLAAEEPLLEAGRRLSAPEIGLLAAQGVDRVRVFRRLRVAIIATGDELVPPGQSLKPGQIHDSNRPMLRAALESLGFEVLDPGVVPDEPDALRSALQDADARADAVITSGGVSVGEADHVRAVLEEIGDMRLWRVAIKPGKPFAFGHLPDSMLFGLPGNPVSALVTLHQLVVPALLRMQGGHYLPPLRLRARADEPFRKKPGREDYQRGVLVRDEQGQPVVRSTGRQGSAILTSMTGANCFVVLSADQGTVEAGEMVEVEPFIPPLRYP